MNLTPQFLDNVEMTAKILGGVALIAGFVAWWIYSTRRDVSDRHRATDHMAKNPALDPGEFGQTYFPADQAEIARRLRELLAPHLPLDLARLHPDDRLVEDLRMDSLDSMSTVEFIIAVEKNFDVKISHADGAALRTLRDLTVLVQRLRSTRPR